MEIGPDVLSVTPISSTGAGTGLQQQAQLHELLLSLLLLGIAARELPGKQCTCPSLNHGQPFPGSIEQRRTGEQQTIMQREQAFEGPEIGCSRSQKRLSLVELDVWNDSPDASLESTFSLCSCVREETKLRTSVFCYGG